MDKISQDWRLDKDKHFDNERVRFVDYLNLDLQNKNVLEMAAGACGTLTTYLHNKKANITITDGRISNLEYNIKRNELQNINYYIADYDKENSIEKKYDVIFCFGLLYHLNNIENVVKSIGENCNDYALISTCVRRNDEESNTYIDDICNALPGGDRVNKDSLKNMWLDSEVGEMPSVSLLEKFQSKFQVWIITNTTDLHIKNLKSNFTCLNNIDGIITSERAGAHKPHPAIFSFALSKSNI